MACFYNINEKHNKQFHQTRTALRPPLFISVHLKNVQLLARMPEDTFYKVHTRLLELCFYNALYIMNTSYM